MPVSPAVLARIFQAVAHLSQVAFHGSRLIKRADSLNVDEYLVSIVRRGSLGTDGAVSQMVKMFKNGKLFEVWHVVTKAGRIIHKDIKQILK